MADELHLKILKLKERFSEERVALRDAVPTETLGYNPDVTITNSRLLIDTLEDFVSDSRKSMYLPYFIRQLIDQHVSGALVHFEQVPAGKWAEHLAAATAVLNELDRLYASCLQYGIITFGFQGRELQKRIDELRVAADDANAIRERLDKRVQRFDDDLEKKSADLTAELKRQVEVAHGEIRGQLDTMAPLLKKVEDLAASAETNLGQTKQSSENAQVLTNEVAAMKDQMNSAAAKMQEHLAELSTAAETTLSAIQSSAQQVEESRTRAASADNAAREARAAVATQLEEVREFNGDIEKYKQQMTDAKKDADAMVSKAVNETDARMKRFGERTESIVTENESIQAKIKEYLQLAVGASLFSAFDKRRRRVSINTYVWGALLALSITGAIWWAYWFAEHIAGNGKDHLYVPVMLARLLFAAPLTFLITFCAKQYSKERRAEEEYAFKSTISVSLDAYRDLLQKATKENPGAGAKHLESLVSEVFDNPVKRLYPAGSHDVSNEDGASFGQMMKIAEKALDKIPGG